MLKKTHLYWQKQEWIIEAVLDSQTELDQLKPVTTKAWILFIVDAS